MRLGKELLQYIRSILSRCISLVKLALLGLLKSLLNLIKGKLIWVEWAHKFAKIVSKKKWKNKKVFVRLHRYEIDTDYMKKIKWQNIDKIIFVNKNFEKQFTENINSKLETVYSMEK